MQSQGKIKYIFLANELQEFLKWFQGSFRKVLNRAKPDFLSLISILSFIKKSSWISSYFEILTRKLVLQFLLSRFRKSLNKIWVWYTEFILKASWILRTYHLGYKSSWNSSIEFAHTRYEAKGNKSFLKLTIFFLDKSPGILKVQIYWRISSF